MTGPAAQRDDRSEDARSHADEALRRDSVVWLSSVQPNGRPHLVPVWFHWDGERIVAFSKPNARKVGNLRDGGLEAVWNGAAMGEFRRRVNSEAPPEPCTVCPMQRLENNYASYVPGLPESERLQFERRCVEASTASPRGDRR